MRRKRHWYNQYNFLAPFINLNNSIKNWWTNKDWRERKKINDIVNKIFFIAFVIVALFYGANKIIAYEYTEMQSQKLEMAKLEREAILKEERMRELQQIEYQQEERKRQKENNQADAKRIENIIIAKQIKKDFPIGTYIKVNNEWVGKIKSINGNRIITTDGWQCYVSEDLIEYSQVREYKNFINENSKG